jgi:hypothetical protein
MNSRDSTYNLINQVAGREYTIKSILRTALQAQIIQPGNEIVARDCKNMYELWVMQYGDKFYTMANLIQLCSIIETGFRDYYREKKSYLSLVDLTSDKEIKGAHFQRLIGDNPLQNLFLSQLSVNLESLPDFLEIKKAMVLRHLYAHRSGLVDQKFINDWEKLTGQNLEPNFTLVGYPNKDVFWFEPLSNISNFIEAARCVFKQLP